jgi:hypothetical protein
MPKYVLSPIGHFLFTANAKDQPVAATDLPMCAQPIGNSAASFCSAVSLERRKEYAASVSCVRVYDFTVIDDDVHTEIAPIFASCVSNIDLILPYQVQHLNTDNMFLSGPLTPSFKVLLDFCIDFLVEICQPPSYQN